VNDVDIDLARNTPWVDVSACVKFGVDGPSRLAGYTEHRYRQTHKHNAFYYIDLAMRQLPVSRYLSPFDYRLQRNFHLFV